MAKSRKNSRNRVAHTHDLKCDPDHFIQLIHGLKTFEFRYNDRDFQVLDFVSIAEFDFLKDAYTGRTALFQITHLLTADDLNFYCQPTPFPAGFVILSIQMVIRTV